MKYLIVILAVFCASSARCAVLMDIVTKGSTDRSVTILIIDAIDGTPETSVAHDASGIDLWYRREGEAKTPITEASLSALTDAHVDGGLEPIGNGEYRLDLPDAAFAPGANYVDVGGTVTGMIVRGGRVRLVDWDIETELADDAEIATAVESEIDDRLPSAESTANMDIVFDNGFAAAWNAEANRWVVEIDDGGIPDGEIPSDQYNHIRRVGDGQAYATISAAVAAAEAGDAIVIYPGTYDEAVDASGVDDLTLIGVGNPTITHTDDAVATLLCGDRATLIGLTVVANLVQPAVNANDISALTIDRCHFDGVADGLLATCSASEFGALRLTNSTFQGAVDACALSGSFRSYLENCRFHTTSTAHASTGSSGLVISSSSGVLPCAYVRNCQGHMQVAEGSTMTSSSARSGALQVRRAVVLVEGGYWLADVDETDFAGTAAGITAGVAGTFTNSFVHVRGGRVDFQKAGGSSTVVAVHAATDNAVRMSGTVVDTAAFAGDVQLVDKDVSDVLADTADMQPKLGAISDLGGGATLGANLADIEGQTDDIGAAGAGLTALASQSSVNTIDGILDNIFTAFELDDTTYRLTEAAVSNVEAGGSSAEDVWQYFADHVVGEGSDLREEFSETLDEQGYTAERAEKLDDVQTAEQWLATDNGPDTVGEQLQRLDDNLSSASGFDATQRAQILAALSIRAETGVPANRTWVVRRIDGAMKATAPIAKDVDEEIDVLVDFRSVLALGDAIHPTDGIVSIARMGTGTITSSAFDDTSNASVWMSSGVRFRIAAGANGTTDRIKVIVLTTGGDTLAVPCSVVIGGGG